MTNKTEQEKYIDLLASINKAQAAEISQLRQNLDALGGSYDKTLNFKPEENLSYWLFHFGATHLPTGKDIDGTGCIEIKGNDFSFTEAYKFIMRNMGALFSVPSVRSFQRITAKQHDNHRRAIKLTHNDILEDQGVMKTKDLTQGLP